MTGSDGEARRLGTELRTLLLPDLADEVRPLTRPGEGSKTRCSSLTHSFTSRKSASFSPTRSPVVVMDACA